jgi:hypothetical protein
MSGISALWLPYLIAAWTIVAGVFVVAGEINLAIIES